ncbi:MAG: UDP-N-acetylglucosamine 1-carboxyvinyltransferase [Deltaproteobacteria bacterium]|nr:UDP-N-acetylglucosamine 1-carboxyvinyltransferase [Deltaproteobacteria bacterium]
MYKIVIEGGRPLVGEVTLSGAKNAALPILASTLLTNGVTVLTNVPDLSDVRTMGRLLQLMGAEVTGRGTIKVDSRGIHAFEAPYELVKTMRASVLVLGPMVARFGRARVSLPGGCAIGTRPIDLHLDGLKAMGAQVDLRQGYVEARCKRLHGADLVLRQPTVTGTENLMMAACLAKGRTTIENAAREPEVEELARVLNKMGAVVRGAGTSYIVIEGVDDLHPVEHAVIPDRIEGGTFMVAAVVTGGDILVTNALPEHCDAMIQKLRASGADIQAETGGLRVRGTGAIAPLDISTAPFPGFPTDMQAQFMVLATQAVGPSVITETIFENRFMHVSELCRMGADIEVRGKTAIVHGEPGGLQGATVMATDLRASASLILAGLVAKGTTEVLRVYHLDRGYEAIEKKLTPLGAAIWRVRADGP